MYTVDYFIKKFEAIPEELWLIREFRSGNKGCVNGLTDMGDEFNKLTELFNSHRQLFSDLAGALWYQQNINNGDDKKYQQPTAKQRILAALYDIKANEAVKEAEIIINNSSLQTIQL